jgi:hypothetical protein
LCTHAPNTVPQALSPPSGNVGGVLATTLDCASRFSLRLILSISLGCSSMAGLTEIVGPKQQQASARKVPNPDEILPNSLCSKNTPTRSATWLIVADQWMHGVCHNVRLAVISVWHTTDIRAHYTTSRTPGDDLCYNSSLSRTHYALPPLRALCIWGLRRGTRFREKVNGFGAVHWGTRKLHITSIRPSKEHLMVCNMSP